MYIDTIEGRLLPTIPAFYRYASGFNALSDDELETFGIYRVVSYIQDEFWSDFNAILGTPYFKDIDFRFEAGSENPGENVRIEFDKDASIEAMKSILGRSDEYASLEDVLLDRPIQPIVEPQVAPEPVIDLQTRYIFIVLGNHTLNELATFTDMEADGIERFQYEFVRHPLPVLPEISVGQTVSQLGGFSGVVDFIDEEQQVFKVVSVSGDLQNDADIKVGNINIASQDIFRFEVYSDALIDGEPMDFSHIQSALADLRLKLDMIYPERFPDGCLVKIELGTIDCSMDREYTITGHGRLL